MSSYRRSCWYSRVGPYQPLQLLSALLIPSSSQREITELHRIRSRFLHCKSRGKILPVTVGEALALTQPPTRAKSHLLLGSEVPQILLSFPSNRWWWLFLPSFSLCSWLPWVGFSAHDLCIVHTVPNSLKLQAEKQRAAQTAKRDGRIQRQPLLHRRWTSRASGAGEPALHCVCQPEQDFKYPRHLHRYNFWYKASYNFTRMSIIYIHTCCSPIAVKIVPMQLCSGISI